MFERDRRRIEKERDKIIDSIMEIRHLCFLLDKEYICDSYIEELKEEVNYKISTMLRLIK